MKVLTERTEIAQALNFGKYPVLNIELDNEKLTERTNGSTERYCVGCDVKVEYRTKNFDNLTTRGQIYYDCFDSECCLDNFKISSEGSCMKDSFGYEDVIEDLKWAKAPTVKAGQEVVIVVTCTKNKLAVVAIGKVSDKIDPYCMTCARIK